MSEERGEVGFDLEAVLDSIPKDDNSPIFKSSSHFIHATEVIAQLKTLANYRLVGPSELDPRQLWQIRLGLSGMIGKYQYESHLLDPHLEDMISILIKPMRKVVHDITVGDFKGQPMNEIGTEIFYMIYFISNTRGYKTVGEL
ncbi:hypothetical protein BGZ99_007550 [Dissophora globulifera]|uniref:Uncharacterized protein n=1 Tax=Dissophora globulifera TaxID=979702 RepID=A0A9P6UYD6_9FUNG|nr:hypothetical protein BGZ99_007550 [Dissophora globulifera]